MDLDWENSCYQNRQSQALNKRHPSRYLCIGFRKFCMGFRKFCMGFRHSFVKICQLSIQTHNKPYCHGENKKNLDEGPDRPLALPPSGRGLGCV
jgi:hypothetical protein